MDCLEDAKRQYTRRALREAEVAALLAIAEQLSKQVEYLGAIRQHLNDIAVFSPGKRLHPPTYVRCSCGRSTVVMWDEASQGCEGPKGWTFDWEENGGWTCGQDGHRQAEAHYYWEYDRDPIVHQDEPHRL